MKLKKLLLSILIVAVFSIITSITSNAANETISFNVNVANDYTSAYEVLELVNKERKAEGLNELKMDKDLLDAAMIRASELVLNFSHTRPNGTSCFTAINKPFSHMGENIAAGQSTSKYVMQCWMESPGHKANILTGDFTSIGIGCVKYGNVPYWVQLFGESNTITPAVKLNNSKITRKVDMLSSDVQLYYNSMKEIFKGDYKNGFETTIVVLNPGWQGRCTTIDPNDLIFESSDKSVFIVDNKGILKFNSAGKAYLTATLKQNKNISVKKEINAIVRMYELKLDDIKDQIFTGKDIRPEVTIKDGDYTLVNNKDYKITYTNNKKYGKATAKIELIGSYLGTAEKTFNIVPPKVTKLKVKSTSTNTINLTWKKTNGVTGYKVYLYDYSKGKYKYYGKTNKTSIKIKNLKSGTKYKVRVRAYKSVNGTQYFGEYTTALKTTTTPKKVTNLKTKSKSKNSIKLSWKKSNGSTGYKVYVYNTKTKKYEYYGKTSKTSITIKKLKSGKSYKIKVRPYKTIEGKQYLGENSGAIKVSIKSTSKKVYITPKGKRYHLNKNCGGKNSYSVNINTATSYGLTACKKCSK